MSDWELIQEYAKSRSETAFGELVRRHLPWVYSVALRQVGQPQLAEEVAQSVFVLLAHKAGSLRAGTNLGGWLFRTTCFVGSRARRAEQRQRNRDQAVAAMTAATTLPDNHEAVWEQLTPHLDQAVAALSKPDRIAILLRFYEKKPLSEVGQRLGIKEEAAKKRVSRAVDKLRSFLVHRGVTMGGTALVGLLMEKTVQAAPLALGTRVLKAASAGVSASAVLPQLAQETIKAWRWAKVKLAAGIGAASLAAIFVAVNVVGLLPRQAATPLTPVDVSPREEAVGDTTDQVVAAPAVPTVTGNTPITRKNGALTGWVGDELGHPIPGARVWGGFGQHPFAQDTTDQSGWFALEKIEAPPFVTVTADGYAADQQQVDLTNAPGPLVFRLSPARPLSVRLVDESAQGVAGARLFLQEWWGRAGTLGQDLAEQTDAEGRLEWLSPPKGELQVSFSKCGYRYSRTNKLTADGELHVIVLHPLAAVSGSVTDADVGTPLATFKLTLGHSQPRAPANPVPMWDMRSQSCSNGLYRAVIEEEQVPYVRIEAEGYETVEAAIQLTNGVEVVHDFPLKRATLANSIRGIVVLPDGTPAAGVEVALCTANVGVMLNGTSFEPEAFGNLPSSQKRDYRRKTDAHGSFSFGPKPGAHTVAAVSSAGLGRARCFNFSKPLEIKLQPWGRIEGNVQTRDGQWANRLVRWRPTGNLTGWMTLFSKGCSVRSDAAGRFTLEHVPPGDGWVVIEDNPSIPPILSPALQLNPGETAQIQVGGIGGPVTGRLVAPPGIEIRSWPNQVTFAQLHVEWEAYPMPKDCNYSGLKCEM